MNKIQIFLLSVFLITFHFLLAEVSVSTTTYINLKTPVNSQSDSGNGASASSLSLTSGASASASANSGMSISISTSSNSMGLSYTSNSSAYLRTNYYLEGNSSGEAVPLEFNCRLSGQLNVRTKPGDNGSNSSAVFRYNFYNGTSGGESLGSQAGRLVHSSNSHLSSSGITATITPIIRLSASGDLIDLLPEDLKEMNIRLDGVNTDYDNVTSSILSALSLTGLPRLNILPGVDAEIGYDVDYAYDAVIPVTYNTLTNGIFMFNASGVSSTTSGAVSNVNFDHSFNIQSITIPDDYDKVDPSSLTVRFDNGVSIPVTRSHHVPEPNTFVFILISSALLLVRRKKK